MVYHYGDLRSNWCPLFHLVAMLGLGGYSAKYQLLMEVDTPSNILHARYGSGSVDSFIYENILEIEWSRLGLSGES